MVRRRGSGVILDFDQAAWAHLAKALGAHVRWARTQAIAVPDDVLKLADLASRSASDRQDPSKLTGWSALTPDGSMDSQLIDYSGAARELDVSKSTVERLVADGDLPSVRIRGARRIRTDDLAAYTAELA